MPSADRKWTRKDALKLYSNTAPDVNLDQQEFRFTLIQTQATRTKTFVVRRRTLGETRRAARRAIGRVNERTSIDGVVESCEWVDEGGESGNAIPILRGTIAIRLPAPEDEQGRDPKIEDGDRVRCDVRWGGDWHEVWMMRIAKPVTTVGDGTIRLELADDCLLLSQSRASFRYRKGKKKRKRGWKYDQIIRDIAGDFGFNVSCVKGKAWITNLSEADASPLDMIRQAVAKESKKTKLRYAIYWRNNRLNVHPLRRNAMLYVLADQITEASVERSRKAEMATAIRARGSAKGKKGKRKKFSDLIVNGEAVARFGYIERPVRLSGSIDSKGELLAEGKRELAKRMKPVKKVELTHVGIAFVRRFDAVLVHLPEQGYEDNRGLMWVSAVTHSLSSGSYTMSVTLRVEDSIKGRTERDAVRRQAARAKREKKEKKS